MILPPSFSGNRIAHRGVLALASAAETTPLPCPFCRSLKQIAESFFFFFWSTVIGGSGGKSNVLLRGTTADIQSLLRFLSIVDCIGRCIGDDAEWCLGKGLHRRQYRENIFWLHFYVKCGASVHVYISMRQIISNLFQPAYRNLMRYRFQVSAAHEPSDTHFCCIFGSCSPAVFLAWLVFIAFHSLDLMTRSSLLPTLLRSKAAA